METIRGIPDKYLYAACLAMAFVLFCAGGTAFDQSPFYGDFSSLSQQSCFLPACILVSRTAYFSEYSRCPDMHDK